MRKDSVIRIPFAKIKITLHDATSGMTETHAQTNRRSWVNNMPLQAQIVLCEGEGGRDKKGRKESKLLGEWAVRREI